jgi:transcriptional regulator with XRE-family HTH domain
MPSGFEGLKVGMSYGDELRRERLRRGLTQRAASRQLGVTESTVYEWEAGHRAPAPNKADRVRAWLADPAYRYRGSGMRR